MQCSQCGSELRADFQFCPECGHPVPSPVDLQGPAPTVVDVPAGPDWILAIMSGAGQGSSFPMGDRLVIGREEDCDVILADERASRRHATIERTGESSFRLVDHESTNGTFVNEQRMEGTADLLPGTPFRIGSTTMAVVPTRETCAQCGQPLEGATAFCGNCGHPIGAEVVVDLEQMAQNIEQAAGRKSTPSVAPAVVEGQPAPLNASFPVSSNRISAFVAKVPGRWIGVGCLVFVLLCSAVAACSLAINFLQDL